MTPFLFRIVFLLLKAEHANKFIAMLSDSRLLASYNTFILHCPPVVVAVAFVLLLAA
jgi:hypothetical protein